MRIRQLIVAILPAAYSPDGSVCAALPIQERADQVLAPFDATFRNPAQSELRNWDAERARLERIFPRPSGTTRRARIGSTFHTSASRRFLGTRGLIAKRSVVILSSAIS
jgi:hypothetical protein